MINDLKEIINNFTAFIDLSIRTEPSQARNNAFRFPTSAFLINNFGFPNIEMHITENTIRKIYNVHGVPLDFLKKLPELLYNHNEDCISLVFKSHTHKDSSVVVSFEFVGQKPIIIAIAKNKQVNNNDYVNNISSVYEKDNAKAIFQRWENSNLLIYKNPKKDLIFPNKTPIIIKRKLGLSN